MTEPDATTTRIGKGIELSQLGVVTFRNLLAGYDAAVERFNEAAAKRDPSTTFHPLFEALNWAVVLDDQARMRWAPTGTVLGWGWRTQTTGGDVVNAVRCARNRVHHQWADSLILSEGFSAPLIAPLVGHEWRWRLLADLPAAEPPKGKASAAAVVVAEADYERLLANRPARNTLRELVVPFRHLADLVEPHRA